MLYKATMEFGARSLTFEGLNEDVVADINNNFKKRAIYYFRGPSADYVLNFDDCLYIKLEKIPQ